MNEEELLSEYADGRLATAAKAAFEARMASDPALARRARVLKAMKSALAASAPKMPADLKSALKREARAADVRRRRSPWRVALKDAFSAPWAFGAGAAAFGAAALVIALHRPSAPHANPKAAPAVSGASSFSDPAVSQSLESLWHDDNGGDGDES
jgi:anti-sigma factor RsiW